MRLSAPIHRLKRQAKLMSRACGIPLHAALDRVAASEGFAAWSLLAARHADDLGGWFDPGDLALIGARPRQGKTLLGLRFAIEAMRAGHRCVVFSLEFTERELRRHLSRLGADLEAFGDLFVSDTSDAIDADHIIAVLAGAPRGTLAVVDYLQLLDQRRDSPALAVQIGKLREFARERGVTLVFISQIDRSYDPATKPFPDLDDVRLPNPLDLHLFDKACFLNAGEVRLHHVGREGRPS